VCFGTRGIVLCRTCDVEIVQDAGSVFNTGSKENGGVGGKKREWRCRWTEGIYILESLQFDPYPAFGWLMNTKQCSLHLSQPPSTSSMSSLERRLCTRGHDSLRHRPLLRHYMARSPLRPPASSSELSCSQVVPTVQPSNTATNA